MIENMALLDPDDVRQWESFTAPVKQDQSFRSVFTEANRPFRGGSNGS
jgi:hypothetical protein